MDTKDGRHFEVWPDGRPGTNVNDSEENVPSTERGLGGIHPQIQCANNEGRSNSAQNIKEALERAVTQEFPTDGSPIAIGNTRVPAFLPKHVPSIHPTKQFFLTGRVESDTDGATDTSRGCIKAKTFLGIGAVPKEITYYASPTSTDDVNQAITKPHHQPAPDSNAKKLAKMALLRTMNFMDHLILKSPQECRASLEKRKVDLIVPRHIPGDDEIYRFEYYARSVGYYGPVLWFIPPNMTFHDLVAADLLVDDWWHKEQNFPEGFTTFSPFDLPLGLTDYTEPGYWVLAIPGIMPGTTCKSFDEQSEMLPDIARQVGLEVENGVIHPRHRMKMFVCTVVDVLYFCAIAQYSKELFNGVPLIARTANSIKAFQEEFKDFKGKKFRFPQVSLYGMCRACVEFGPGTKLRITDWIDAKPSQGVGIIVFTIPKVYI
ncbi:MAG: hypothetical protein P1P90_06105 [Patescibacteria group bacterium]|nr:hypothetical protein [Patescibacteria group bacterium]